ncbi:bifunctional 2-polyprenyl-6-hydroxyphenol methylase/3-demethylubiquinol 3-O-methyltransferase UbiG [Lewinella sp. W8]|uniref:class I SAM-dependent methyltransferase n=1 Tax=Lewinella sp. W8 TaxID=2528208 RepID=UPI0010677BC0|nr:methyltransferase domain-containing protein [Lewinella sp. W8]MTB51093.1 methyltransferase domain-containing protein [Lewinella sp. W8]
MTPKITSRWRVAQYLERRWWRRYLRAQDPQAYLRNKRDYWVNTLRMLEWEVVPGRRSLDAGCGPAGIFIALHEQERMTAMDPLLDAYEKDLAIFSRQDYPGVRFLTGHLETPPESLEPFPAIYCLNAINHVSDWDRSLEHLTALAAPGARLLLSSDVHRHRWLLPIFRALPGDLLHPQQHPASAYRRALEKRGWTIEREVVLRETAIFNYVAWVATKH